MTPVKVKLCIKDVRNIKTAVRWAWENRVNLFISAFVTILLTKWIFGRITTDQVLEAIKLVNPLNIIG